MADSTKNENTRNDRYAIMKNGEGTATVIAYGKHLIDYINGLNVLSYKVTKSHLEDSRKFRSVVDELDREKYYVFQLTRL